MSICSHACSEAHACPQLVRIPPQAQLTTLRYRLSLGHRKAAVGLTWRDMKQPGPLGCVPLQGCCLPQPEPHTQLLPGQRLPLCLLVQGDNESLFPAGSPTPSLSSAHCLEAEAREPSTLFQKVRETPPVLCSAQEVLGEPWSDWGAQGNWWSLLLSG